MSNLLQKASIVTTPTAYGVGVLNSIKPAQSFGEELIVNGNFETDSNWNNSDGGNDWQIVNGKLILTTTSANNVNQGIGLVQNKFYKIVFTISNTTLGGLRIRLGTGSFTSTYTDGTHTLYLEQTTTNDAFRFYADSSGVFNGSIDNVSVKQVDPNDRWVLGTGWSKEQGKAVKIAGSSGELVQLSVFPSGFLSKTFKITFTLEVTAGSVRLRAGTNNQSYLNSSGTYSYTLTPAGNDQLKFNGDSSFVGSVTNISVLEVQQTDIPRLDYTNGTASILLEPQSTNIIEYSEDFSNSYWAKSGAVVISDSAVSPDGTLNADKLNFTASNGEIVKGMTFISGQTYTMSFYAKTESGTLDFIYGNMDYSTISGTATNEWQRFVITQTLPTATRFPKIQTTEIGSLLLWGWQVEQQSYPTSYIPTEGSAVTRAAETLNNAGNSDLINSTEGVLYCEIAAFSNSGQFGNITLNDGSATNRVRLEIENGQIKVKIDTSSGQVASFSHSVDVTSFSKIGIKWKENDFALYVDGIETNVDNSGVSFAPNTLNNLAFDRGDTLQDFYGRCKSVAVFKEALSDTELACLTSTNNREILLNYYYRMQYVGANTEALSCAEQTFKI